MVEPRIGTLLRHAARLLGRPNPATTDAALLDRLTRDRDSAAFEELVTRHGPAVWSLCRRLVRTEADAEDVFQATFLVLARDAARVRKAASVGSWLYGVAFRIGRKVRRTTSRTPDLDRLRRPATPPDPACELSWSEVRAVLDEELARLPDEIRAPLLLCYFEGMTQDEAATALGWPTRRVKARVARGRDVLRRRLTRRGIELPTVLSVPLLSTEVASALPARLLTGLSTAATSLVRGGPLGPHVSPTAVALAQPELSKMTFLRLALLIVSAAGLLAAGSLVGRPADPPTPDPLPPVVADLPKPAADDMRPAGAVRIGTTQFRHDEGSYLKPFFTADGKHLIAPTGGKWVGVWDAETGHLLHDIPIPESQFYDADFVASANLLALIGYFLPDEERSELEWTVWLVDTAARKVVRTIRMPATTHSVWYLVRFTPDGKRLFTSLDHEVRVWDVKSGDELLRQSVKNHSGSFAISPDGKAVAYGRYEIFLWKWDSGEEPKKFVPLTGFGTELITFGPNGKTLYVHGYGGSVTKIWDVATGRQTGTLDGFQGSRDLVLSPDGKTLASSAGRESDGHRVALWDVATGKERGRLPLGRVAAGGFSWSPDGSRLAAKSGYRLWTWDVRTKQPLGPTAPGHEGSLTGFAFASDGRLFTSSDDHTVRSWDAATGRPGLTLTHASYVRGLALSPDGSWVAGSALENDLRVWDAKTGRERYKLLGNGRLGGVRKVRFTPDGKRLVAWGDDLYVRVWDVGNGKLLSEHRTLPTGVTEADLDDPQSTLSIRLGMWASDLSPDGTALAIGSGKIVQVFEVNTGKERLGFEGDPHGVVKLDFSPDGKRLGIAGRAKPTETRLPSGQTRHSSGNTHPVGVWDLTTRKPIWQTDANGYHAADVGFTADGLRFAEAAFTRDPQQVLRVWDAATGRDLGRIDLAQRCSHFAFDPAGKRVAVAQPNTTAVVYDLDTALKPNVRKE